MSQKWSHSLTSKMEKVKTSPAIYKLFLIMYGTSLKNIIFDALDKKLIFFCYMKNIFKYEYSGGRLIKPWLIETALYKTISLGPKFHFQLKSMLVELQLIEPVSCNFFVTYFSSKTCSFIQYVSKGRE